MTLAYGIIAAVSLAMVGLCAAMDKKRDIWLILVFVSVFVCNLGYFMVSASHSLGAALTSNRIAYLGSVFLPFFMLMMVLRFCNMPCGRGTMIALVSVGIVMLTITCSPGILPVYYSAVSIETVNGATKLVREYGSLHALYYVYLFAYMAGMLAVTLYAIGRKKIRSLRHIVFLLGVVLCNIVIWLAEQFLPRGFEWLSLSYILTECFILAIYRSMQRQGQMIGNAASYQLNVLLAIFLLLFASVIRVVTEDTGPTLFIISHIVVLLIYLGILISWAVSVQERIMNRSIRRYLLVLVGLMILWFLARTLRHTVFYRVYPVGMWCWYAYYISMLLIPLLCFFAAKYSGQPEDYRLPRKWYLLYIPTLALIAGILTNDAHELAFSFYAGYEAGWDIYHRRILYYLATVWIFGCIALMIVQILRRSRIPGTRKVIWLTIAMLGIGVLYSVLYAVNRDIFGFIEVTAALCFAVVGIWESCIKTGLVQSNAHYSELLKLSDLGVTVVDDHYRVHYRSEAALPLTRVQMEKTHFGPLLLRDGIRVSGNPIRGGRAIWQEDVSELLETLESLRELRVDLQNANEVSMENYQLSKRIRKLSEQNRLHDELHRQTAHQIDLLNDWLIRFMESVDAAEKHELLCRIVVVGAYLKRRDNLSLLIEQDGFIRPEEFELSIQEMMKNLQLAGVRCAGSVQIDRMLPANAAVKLFDFYEYVTENALDGLSALLARFFCRDGDFYACVDTVCASDLKHLVGENISVSDSEDGFCTLTLCVKGGGEA